ncbi:hypothetical protein JOF53_004770 [Crossiella equi]|uniref:Uncharacterized protein n=1 Tax=Crossiella equi TaxID=130796 RepID=A0ABS5AH41_9PSEU|nr:hypothetical protein [Crossiella equi]MBP2475898.1 hypothetical protein [Crossiella equi]
MNKRLGLLTRAVAGASALAILAAPIALADETDPASAPATTTTTSAAVPTTTTTTSSQPVTSTPTTPPGSTTTSPRTTTPKPTTSTSEKPDPEGKPWQDKIYGLVTNPNEPTQAAIVIGCAAGKPTNVASSALTIEEPVQSEVDPRVYVSLAELKPGVALGEYQITAQCGAKTLSFTFQVIGEEEPGKPGKTPVLGKKGKGTKKTQVGFTPRGGVETGFGGAA